MSWIGYSGPLIPGLSGSEESSEHRSTDALGAGAEELAPVKTLKKVLIHGSVL